MEDQAHVILVTQTRVKFEKQDQFATWLGKLSQIVENFPGYVTQKISAPNLPVQQDWIVMQYFVSKDRAKAWLQSKERQKLIDEISSFTFNFDDTYLVDLDQKSNQHPVTATIATKVKPEKEQEFMNWHLRISAIESKFPGFIGSRIEGPRPGIHDSWITILTFDSNEHLETWLNSAERKNFLNELISFSDKMTLRRMYSGFDIWFSQTDNVQPSVLKSNMLILLTLYPVVFLYSYYVQPYVIPKWMPFWSSLFIGNAISTIILGWATVPFLVKMFNWWLEPINKIKPIYNVLGFFAVFSLYILFMLTFSYLSK